MNKEGREQKEINYKIFSMQETSLHWTSVSQTVRSHASSHVGWWGQRVTHCFLEAIPSRAGLRLSSKCCIKRTALGGGGNETQGGKTQVLGVLIKF